MYSLQTNAGASQNVSTGKSERIPSHDFRAWDKYDVDREAERVDNEAKKSSPSAAGVSPKGIPTELSETGMHLCVPIPPSTHAKCITCYVMAVWLFSCREKHVKHREGEGSFEREEQGK